MEADVYLEGGARGRAAVPSGASTGIHEAVELRDQDTKRYLGKGVHGAVQNIKNKIFPAISGMDAADQEKIDRRLIDLDGTDHKSNLGANSILAVSLACARAETAHRSILLFRYLGGESAVTLPVPFMNIINGGKHADNNLDFQEFMIVPHGFSSFKDALRAGAEVYHHLKKVLEADKLNTNVGDEGGFAPNLSGNEEALAYIMKAITAAGYKPGREISVALDVAASSFYENEKYVLGETKIKQTSLEMIFLYEKLADKYPIVTIEDGLGEDDWEGWQALTQKLTKKLQLVGDDLFVTSVERLQKGIEMGVANSILIKVNQIGTLTETLQTMKTAKSAGYRCMVSHRSGETEDSFIADLAVATGCGQLKCGAPARSDRLAKYNQLLRIEEELGDQAVFAGNNFIKR